MLKTELSSIEFGRYATQRLRQSLGPMKKSHPRLGGVGIVHSLERQLEVLAQVKNPEVKVDQLGVPASRPDKWGPRHRPLVGHLNFFFVSSSTTAASRAQSPPSTSPIGTHF